MLGHRLHVVAVEPDQQADDRSSQRRGDDGHGDQHPEQRRRQDTSIQPDVQQDQLHRPAGVHQDAKGQRARARVVENSPRQVDARHDFPHAGNAHHQRGDPQEVARELHSADTQPGVGEEEGHQEHPHELFHHLLRDVGQDILRDDGAHDEASEDDVDPRQLSSREAEEQDGAQHSELIAVVQVPLLQEPLQDRADHQHHTDDVAGRVEEGPDGILDTHRSRHGRHDREDHVHQDVVYAGDGHSRATEVGPQQAELIHYPAKNRKGRRGDAEPHEQVEHQTRHLGSPIAVQVITEADPDHEGNHHHGEPDAGNTVARLEVLPVEVLPHLEHVGTDPEQAKAFDEQENVRLEDHLPLVHPDHLTQEHLREDDAREHLHHHPRHADLFGDLAEEQGDHEDGGSDREEANHGVNEQAGEHHGG